MVGYASETGNVDSNRTLSSDRATAVAKVLDQAKPGRLHHIGGVGHGQAMRPRDGPDQSVVAVDEPVPSGLIPFRGGPYELSLFRHVARTYQTFGTDPDCLRV